MKKLIFILLIFFLTMGIASAGNNTTTIDHPTVHTEDTQTVTALESGDSNISFSDGYKGYCIEWGEHSAEAGEKFYVHDEVDNNIKTFFVYFYPESQRDVVATQHMIWKFTDNKEFSKFNKTLYNQIIAKSSTIQVPNEGSIPFGDNQKMVFSFKTFVSEFEEYQNYFGYRIFFENITNDLIENSTNNSTTLTVELENYTYDISFNDTYIIEDENDGSTSTLNYEKIVVSSHETGGRFWFGIAMILLLMIILLYF